MHTARRVPPCSRVPPGDTPRSSEGGHHPGGPCAKIFRFRPLVELAGQAGVQDFGAFRIYERDGGAAKAAQAAERLRGYGGELRVESRKYEIPLIGGA